MFQSAKMLLSTSKFEGFPNTFLEAGNSFIPVVSYRVDPDDFISKSQSGIVCNGCFETMVEAVKGLACDEQLRAKMGKNLHRYVSENHEISHVSREFQKVIDQLVESIGLD